MHQYSPDWFLEVLKVSTFPEDTVLPSLIQVILAGGFPVALQWNVTEAPSMMVLSLGADIMVGGTGTNRFIRKMIEVNILVFLYAWI